MGVRGPLTLFYYYGSAKSHEYPDLHRLSEYILKKVVRKIS